MMAKKPVAICLYLIFALLIWAAENDFKMGEKAYKKGRYKMAEVYLENLLAEKPHSGFIPDATYYLIMINDRTGDFVNMLTYTNRFLYDNKYDHRGREVFDLVLERLIEKGSYMIALDCIKKYDYLISNYSILQEIGFGLLKQERKTLADSILLLCPRSDTIEILRAGMTTDFSRKREIYEGIAGLKGRIYLMEFLLEIGDTVEAYEVYRSTDAGRMEGSILYRYAKISRLFNRKRFSESIIRLGKSSEYKNKGLLLDALHTGRLKRFVDPDDKEECTLLMEYLKLDTVSRSMPDSVNIDSILSDTLTEKNIRALRGKIGDNYYLDSIYCEILLDNEKISEAFSVIESYLRYHNTIDYSRKIRARQHYHDNRFRLAAKDVVLSHAEDVGTKSLLANSLTNIGMNSAYLYREILKRSQDTLLTSQAAKQLLKIAFETKEYRDAVNYALNSFQDDTSLVRIYVYSLVRSGEKRKADSLYSLFFAEQDHDYINYYGEFLIEKKLYKRAESMYDSIIGSADDDLPDRLYYNWAFVPFVQGNMDTALTRFLSYVDGIGNSEVYHKTVFKIATIKYLKQEFDTAAFYYELASESVTLRSDALHNQLICYKKSGDWNRTVEVGKKIMPLVSGDAEIEMQFEIGYALLRAGKARDALEYLRKAADRKTDPEYLYWLGENYVAAGDFVRALYQYQKIVDVFPKDEMWAPTAAYKTGIVFEFMGELDDAEKVYRQIIKKRGLGDTWGIEAQKRLEEIE